MTLLHLMLVFGRLSLLAIGGGLPILAEMQRLSVSHYHWVTNAQFRDSWSLGQITPGPGMLMVAVIGYKAAGIPGAAVATACMFLPTSVLTSIVGRNWDRFATSPWRLSLQRGLSPVVLGLMAAGAYTLGKTAILEPVSATIALVTVVVLLRWAINPALLVLVGGLAGWLFLR